MKFLQPNGCQAHILVMSHNDKFKFAEKDARNAFVVESKVTDKLGYTTVRLQQVYKGIPVYGSTQAANINEDGILTSLSGFTVPNLDTASELKLTKRIGKAKALEIAETDLGLNPEYQENPDSKLIIYALDGEPKYAYLVNLYLYFDEKHRKDTNREGRIILSMIGGVLLVFNLIQYINY